MKFFTTLSALVLATAAVARPLDDRTLEERQGGVIYLTQKEGNTKPRLEIRTLKDTQPNQYNLLMIALSRWQKASQSDQAGFFGVAGIHGVPRQNYNNVGQCSSCGGADGYAVHDSILFPSWHRAYVAFFEQELLKVAKQVASEYPSAQRTTMMKAANNLRWPYYDAGAIPKNGSPAFPALMSEFSIVVNGPKGRTTLNNPLFRTHISNPSVLGYQYFNTFPNTLRYPTSNAADASSNEAATINAMASIRQSVADSFYNLFSNCHDWLHWSNDAAGSSIPSCAGSMEDVHNSIHSAIGGAPNNGVTGGHMFYLPLSSFDPSFWLHHANMDRMTAFWQTLNPNSWASSQNTPTASWTLAQGQPVNQGSALTPFRRAKGGNNGFWTADGVRNWRHLGYTYPEYSNSDGSAASISRAINNLYGPNAGVGVKKRDAVDDVVGDVEDAAQNLTSALPIPLTSPLVAPNASVYQYVANIYTPRYLLNGSYQVFLFNGNPASETDTSTWITDSNLIGMMGVVAMPGMTDNPLIASGSVPLTRTLQDLVSKTGTSGIPILSDLTEALVVPYLTKNLQWRVSGTNAQPLDPGTIPGFVVSVFASTASQPSSDAELPVWSEFVNLVDVTKDQSGGANSTTDATVPSAADAVLSAASGIVSTLMGSIS